MHYTLSKKVRSIVAWVGLGQKPKHLFKNACSFVAWVGVDTVKVRYVDYTLCKKVLGIVAWVGFGQSCTGNHHTSSKMFVAS